MKKRRRISNAYPPHEAGFAGAPDAARLHPGLLRSSRAYCTNTRAPVLGARGRIRTTWPPDLSAPFLNSLLGAHLGGIVALLVVRSIVKTLRRRR